MGSKYDWPGHNQTRKISGRILKCFYARMPERLPFSNLLMTAFAVLSYYIIVICENCGRFAKVSGRQLQNIPAAQSRGQLELL